MPSSQQITNRPPSSSHIVNLIIINKPNIANILYPLRLCDILPVLPVPANSDPKAAQAETAACLNLGLIPRLLIRCSSCLSWEVVVDVQSISCTIFESFVPSLSFWNSTNVIDLMLSNIFCSSFVNCFCVEPKID